MHDFLNALNSRDASPGSPAVASVDAVNRIRPRIITQRAWARTLAPGVVNVYVELYLQSVPSSWAATQQRFVLVATFDETGPRPHVTSARLSPLVGGRTLATMTRAFLASRGCPDRGVDAVVAWLLNAVDQSVQVTQ